MLRQHNEVQNDSERILSCINFTAKNVKWLPIEAMFILFYFIYLLFLTDDPLHNKIFKFILKLPVSLLLYLHKIYVLQSLQTRLNIF